MEGNMNEGKLREEIVRRKEKVGEGKKWWKRARKKEERKHEREKI